MAQIAVDAKGNKIRWDESAQKWVPVEVAVNKKGETLEFDGAKWNPAEKKTRKIDERDFLGIFRSALSGAQAGTASTLGALLKAADFIGDNLGLKRSDATRMLVRDLRSWSETNKAKGTRGLVGQVGSGLGRAAVDIPSIAAMGPAGLPVHGALTGAAEGGLEGALTGAITGSLTHGALKGMSYLRTPARVGASAAFGAATTPGDIEDRVAGAATMGALGFMGGKKPGPEDNRVVIEAPKAQDFAEMDRQYEKEPWQMTKAEFENSGPLVRIVGQDISGEFLHGTKKSGIKTLGAEKPPGAGHKKTGNVIFDAIAPAEQNEFGATLLLSEPRQPHQALLFGSGKGESVAHITIKNGAKILDLSDEISRAPRMTLGDEQPIVRVFKRPAVMNDMLSWYAEKISPGYKNRFPDWKERTLPTIDTASKSFMPDEFAVKLGEYARDRGYDAIRLADETILLNRGAISDVRDATTAELGVARKTRTYPGSKTAALFTDKPTGAYSEVHRQMIAKALADGKPVPSEVLADYPDLATTSGPVGDILGIVPPGFSMPPAEHPEVMPIRNVVKKTPNRLTNAVDTIKGIAKKPGKVVNKLAFEVVDRYDPFRRWDEFIVDKLQQHRAEGKKLSAKALEIADKGMSIGESAYNLLQLRGGAGGDTQLAYAELQKIFKNRVGDLPQEFTDFMVSLRMMERDGRGIANPGGIKTDAALASYQKLIENLPPERQADFRAAAREFTEWSNKHIIKRLVDSGMLSAKDAERIMELNHHPVPFQKFTSKEDLLQFINDVSFDNAREGDRYVNVVGKKIFAMEGMDKNAKIQDPWEAVLERLGAVVGVSERNKALSTFVRMSQLDPTTRGMVRKLKGDSRIPSGYGAFSVSFNGKAQRWTAPLDIIESIKTLQAKDVGFISGLMGKTKNAFVVGTTGLNLPFGLIKNPIRDLGTVLTTSKYGFGPGAYMSGLANSLAANFGFSTKLYRDYLGSRAAFGQFLNRDPKTNARDLFIGHPHILSPITSQNRGMSQSADAALKIAGQVINPLSFFKGISKSIEMAPRIGQFKKNLEGIRKQSPGMSESEVMMKAALLARRSTVDFHRAGDFVKTANYFVPFLNARVQSIVNTAEALTSNKGIRSGQSSLFGIKGDSRAIAAARVATFIVTPALAAYLYNRKNHSEDYDKIPQDTKDRYIVILTGEYSQDPDTGQTKPEAILIPKTDAHQIFWNPTESMLEWAWAKNPQNIMKVATNFFSNISPVQFEKEGEFSLNRTMAGIIPPALQAPLSIGMNKDLYFDRPLVPGRLENVAPEEQYTSYTPEVYKKIGSKLGVSPIKTQRVAESFLGSVARTPSPKEIAKNMAGTLYRRVGKELSTEIYDIDKASKSGYDTARIRAERMVKDGKTQEARDAMRAWNSKAEEYAEKMAKTMDKSVAYIKRQEWYKRISFSLEDMRNTIGRGKTKPQSAIKRQLGIK